MIIRSFSLTPKEIAALRSIRPGGISSKEMAASLHVSAPGLSRLTKSLEQKGLISVRRAGVSNALSFSDMKHATLLRRAFEEHGHMKLERMLSLASLKVIGAIAAAPGSTRGEIMSISGVSARTIQTVLADLRRLGVLSVDGKGIYSIPDRFAPMADFAREFDSYANRRAALEFSPDSAVLWERSGEFLVRTRRDGEAGGFKETAFSVFSEYGVPLLQEWHYYYHPVDGWVRTVDEVLLQSILIRPLGTREITAILMLWEKNGLGKNLDRLKARAESYGLAEEIERIVAYFDDPVKNRPQGFPRIGEVRAKLSGGNP